MNTSAPEPAAHADVHEMLSRLVNEAGLLALPEVSLAFEGVFADVGSRHRLGAAAAVSIAAEAVGAASLWSLRGGRPQGVCVDVRRALLPGVRTVNHISCNGRPVELSPRTHYPPVGFMPTRDGRQFFLLSHIMYPEQLVATLNVLGCTFSPTAIAAAVASFDGDDLEARLAAARQLGVYARTREEWLAHPQGQWLQQRPVVEIERVDDASPPVPLAYSERPLGGVRVLDLSHVLAGPVAARTLAAHGADVLHVSSPHRPEVLAIQFDVGVGKRAAHLDFDNPADRERADALVRACDIIVQSWRPGGLKRHDLDFVAVRRRRPGVIYVSISAYGDEGPWARRGGYDPVGQVVSGLAVAEGKIDAPRLAPTGLLNDYITAYLAAAGAMSALARRARDGGSYHVKVSLARTSMWILDLGSGPDAPSVAFDVMQAPAASEMFEIASAWGDIRMPAPIPTLSRTPTRWTLPPQPRGASAPIW